MRGLWLVLALQEPADDFQLRLAPPDPAPLALGRRLDVLRAAPGATLAVRLRLDSVPEPGLCRELLFLSAGQGPRSAARAALWVRGSRLLAVGRSLDAEPPCMLEAEAGLRAGDRRHLAATFDYPGRRIRLYLDGTLLAEGFARFEGTSTSDTLVAAGTAAAADEIRVYGRVLGEAEIAALAGVRAPGAPGLSAPPFAAGPRPELRGTCGAAGLRIRLFVDGRPAGAARSGPGGAWSCVPDAPLPPGLRALAATAENGAGTSEPSAPAALLVDLEPPAVVVAADAPTAELRDAGGSGLDPAGVLLTVNGVAVPAVVELLRADAGRVRCAAALPPGRHAVAVRARDRAGHEARPAAGFVVVADRRVDP